MPRLVKTFFLRVISSTSCGSRRRKNRPKRSCGATLLNSCTALTNQARIDKPCACFASRYFLSITGALWKQKEDFHHLIRDPTVQEKLLLASDAPFLFPNAKSKLKKSQEDEKTEMFSEASESLVRRYCSFQRNEPCSLGLTCELLAGILDQSPHDVALKTTYNALKAFKLQF